MPKRALGRGLDSLLPRQPQESPARNEPVDSTKIEPAGLGRGFDSLLAGSKESEATTEGIKLVGVISQLGDRTAWWTPEFGYAVVDALLLSISGWLLLGRSETPGWGRIALAAGLVVAACAAGLIPFLKQNHGPEGIAKNGSSTASDWTVVSSKEGNLTRRYLVHLTRPVFVGEIVSRKGHDDNVVPLWIEQGIDGSAQAVEQLVGRLRDLPPRPEPLPGTKAAQLRSVLIRI